MPQPRGSGDRVHLEPSSGKGSLLDIFGIPDQPWMERAICVTTDPEAFYPEKGGSTRDAKSVCTGCDVSAQCLAYALDNDERHGIWGGLSERERRQLAKRERRATA
jgi:predicted Fe-S protein YdhL (DUF1289 family)